MASDKRGGMADAPQLKREFDRDGYAVLRGFLPGDELERLRSHTARYVEKVVPTLDRTEAMYEDRNRRETLKHLPRMEDHDPYFSSLLHSDRLVELAEVLMGGPVVPQNVQWFNKAPGQSEPTPPHQDGYYFMLEPNEAVTLWLALDDVDDANGCVRYLPGTHRLGLREHTRSNVLGFSQGVAGYGSQDEASETPIHAKPGDLLAHHSLAIHLADANTTPDRQRRAISLVYYSQRARKDKTKTVSYQQDLHADLVNKGRL